MSIKGNKIFKNKLGARVAAIILIIVFIVSLLLVGGTGCKKIFFIPGASLGYYIWQDKDNNIHIQWSADRKENSFSGLISTDGKITDLKKNGFEDDDKASLNSQSDKVDFTAKLTPEDYTDEIVLSLVDYSYLEFELKLNGAYDLQRTNLGEFLNSPPSGIFKIGKDYFKDLVKISWYFCVSVGFCVSISLCIAAIIRVGVGVEIGVRASVAIVIRAGDRNNQPCIEDRLQRPHPKRCSIHLSPLWH